MNEILDELRRFDSAVRKIWDCYQVRGPGQVDSQWYPPVANSATRLMALLAESGKTKCEVTDSFAEIGRQQLLVAVKTASRLAKRCACDAAGLCFVTGEAGLIPRRDLIDDFAVALRVVDEACQGNP